jgi:hypothetical protein
MRKMPVGTYLIRKFSLFQDKEGSNFGAVVVKLVDACSLHQIQKAFSFSRSRDSETSLNRTPTKLALPEYRPIF